MRKYDFLHHKLLCKVIVYILWGLSLYDIETHYYSVWFEALLWPYSLVLLGKSHKLRWQFNQWSRGLLMVKIKSRISSMKFPCHRETSSTKPCNPCARLLQLPSLWLPAASHDCLTWQWSNLDKQLCKPLWLTTN